MSSSLFSVFAAVLSSVGNALSLTSGYYICFLKIIIRTGQSIPVELISLVNHRPDLLLRVIFTDFYPSYSKGGASFHPAGFNCSFCSLGWFFDHVRDFLWEDVFNLGASAIASEFNRWVQVGIYVYILDFKYQLKSQSFLFWALCITATADESLILF